MGFGGFRRCIPTCHVCDSKQDIYREQEKLTNLDYLLYHMEK